MVNNAMQEQKAYNLAWPNMWKVLTQSIDSHSSFMELLFQLRIGVEK